MTLSQYTKSAKSLESGLRKLAAEVGWVEKLSVRSNMSDARSTCRKVRSDASGIGTNVALEIVLRPTAPKYRAGCVVAFGEWGAHPCANHQI